MWCEVGGYLERSHSCDLGLWGFKSLMPFGAGSLCFLYVLQIWALCLWLLLHHHGLIHLELLAPKKLIVSLSYGVSSQQQKSNEYIWYCVSVSHHSWLQESRRQTLLGIGCITCMIRSREQEMHANVIVLSSLFHSHRSLREWRCLQWMAFPTSITIIKRQIQKPTWFGKSLIEMLFLGNSRLCWLLNLTSQAPGGGSSHWKLGWGWDQMASWNLQNEPVLLTFMLALILANILIVVTKYLAETVLKVKCLLGS